MASSQQSKAKKSIQAPGSTIVNDRIITSENRHITQILRDFVDSLEDHSDNMSIVEGKVLDLDDLRTHVRDAHGIIWDQTLNNVMDDLKELISAATIEAEIACIRAERVKYKMSKLLYAACETVEKAKKTRASCTSH